MTTYILIAGWIICGVVSYRIGRKGRSADANAWTIGMRASEIGFSIFGPIGLLATFVVYGKHIKFWDKPAKW